MDPYIEFVRCLQTTPSEETQLSRKQRKLQRKHGSPTEFAAAVISMLGEISFKEALATIEKYNKQWRAAC